MKFFLELSLRLLPFRMYSSEDLPDPVQEVSLSTSRALFAPLRLFFFMEKQKEQLRLKEEKKKNCAQGREAFRATSRASFEGKTTKRAILLTLSCSFCFCSGDSADRNRENLCHLGYEPNELWSKKEKRSQKKTECSAALALTLTLSLVAGTGLEPVAFGL